eukprot:6192697-Pleurochrysis_carterae.AAC.5
MNARMRAVSSRQNWFLKLGALTSGALIRCGTIDLLEVTLASSLHSESEVVCRKMAKQSFALELCGRLADTAIELGPPLYECVNPCVRTTGGEHLSATSGLATPEVRKASARSASIESTGTMAAEALSEP